VETSTVVAAKGRRTNLSPSDRLALQNHEKTASSLRIKLSVTGAMIVGFEGSQGGDALSGEVATEES
jgi:hypothetical protein